MQLPPLDGMSTLVVANGADDVHVFDLRAGDGVKLSWAPEGAPLTLGAYVGTVEGLKLERQGELLTLDPVGASIWTPKVAYAVTADGEIAPMEPARFSAPILIAAPRCAQLTVTTLAAPEAGIEFPTLADARVAPDGASVLVATATTGELFRVDATGFRVVGTGVQGLFSGPNGRVWVRRARRIERLGPDLRPVETIDTSSIGVGALDLAEGPGTPRFFAYDEGGTYYSWDGVAPARSLGAPRVERGTERVQLLPREGGVLWTNFGNVFAERSDAEGWRAEELVARENLVFSRLFDTARFGTLLFVGVYGNTRQYGFVRVRKDGAWAPLFGEGVIDRVAATETPDRMLGSLLDQVVELDLGADERPPSGCSVATLSPPASIMLSTSTGVFAYADRASGRRMAWLR